MESEKENNSSEWMLADEIELVYRTKLKPADRPKIRNAGDACRLFRLHWREDKIDLVEQCKILLLNNAQCVLGIIDISSGSALGTVVDTKLIFAAALKANASRIVICHNHPSGNIKPSFNDEVITQKIKSAGLLLDITLVDHIILTSKVCFSFADEGML